MQPYQHLSAKGNNGAVTLMAGKPNEKVVMLGASCATSVSCEDGPVTALTVIPKLKNEVVAIVMVELQNSKWVITEGLLLSVSLDGSKATIDLHMPFASSAKAVGQMIISQTTSKLLVIQGGERRSSKVWDANSQGVITPPSGEDFNSLCMALVAQEESPSATVQE